MEARILTRSATMRHRTKVQPSQTLASDQTQLLKQLMLEIMKSHTLPSDLMKRIKKNLVKMTNLKQVVLLRLKIQKPIVSQILILKSTAQRTEVRTISQDNFSTLQNLWTEVLRVLVSLMKCRRSLAVISGSIAHWQLSYLSSSSGWVV